MPYEEDVKSKQVAMQAMIAITVILFMDLLITIQFPKVYIKLC